MPLTQKPRWFHTDEDQDQIELNYGYHGKYDSSFALFGLVWFDQLMGILHGAKSISEWRIEAELVGVSGWVLENLPKAKQLWNGDPSADEKQRQDCAGLDIEPTNHCQGHWILTVRHDDWIREQLSNEDMNLWFIY